MEKKRVVVTGMGTVSTFGLGSDIYWDSLVKGESGVKPISLFDTELYRSGLGAEIPEVIRSNKLLRQKAGNPKEDATFFATLAAKEAFENANMSTEDIIENQNRIGCIIGTLCSSSKNYEDFGREFFKNFSVDEDQIGDIDPTLISYQLNYLCDQISIKGPSTLISTACSSATDAIGVSFDMIRSGRCDMVLSGGGDVISEVIHAGFNSVRSITIDRPRPFDKDRTGFVIGEGAGMLILESLESALKRDAYIHAEILGYGLSNSAYHLSATSKDGSGEALAMKRSIKSAGLKPDNIDYVNAHGTATLHNDRSELLALKLVFNELSKNVSVNSIKSMIGHCMGAAGALEAISTIKSIETGIIPPTINFNSPEQGNDFDMVVNEKRKKDIQYALSNSFGFAGYNSTVLFGKFN